jgi:hypothetical protein
VNPKPFLNEALTMDRTKEVEKQVDKGGKKIEGPKARKPTEQNIFILLSGFFNRNVFLQVRAL